MFLNLGRSQHKSQICPLRQVIKQLMSASTDVSSNGIYVTASGLSPVTIKAALSGCNSEMCAVGITGEMTEEVIEEEMKRLVSLFT